MERRRPPQRPLVPRALPQQPPRAQVVYIKHAKSAGTAYVLSFFIWGLGQMYGGQFLKGTLLMFVAWPLLTVLSIQMGWWAVTVSFAVWGWQIGDAGRHVSRVNTALGI